jgi:hypothetical protein
LWLSFGSVGQRLLGQVAAFALEKDLRLPDPGLAYTIQEENGELVIDLSARALVRFVDLSFPGPQSAQSSATTFST